MLDAITAEALKLRHHRATWLMVWIYPILTALLVLGTLIYRIGWGSAPVYPGHAIPASLWIEQSTMMLKFPTYGLVRYLLAGFCAVAFAGEYGWNTWKLVIPARARWQLIASKWLVVLGLLFAALLVADIMVLLGDVIEPMVGGAPMPAGIGFGALLYAHGSALLFALVPAVYTVACAGLLAILTRSVLATVLLSIGLVIVEQTLPFTAMFLGLYAPGLVTFFVKLLPFYHIANWIAWTGSGHEAEMMIGTAGMVSIGWQTSLAAGLAWIAGMAGLTLYRFERQDLN